MESYDPGVLEWNHVVNVEIVGLGEFDAVIRGYPVARLSDTGGVGLYICSVSLNDKLARDC